MPMRLWPKIQALPRNTAAGERLIHVVAGAITAPDGRVLLAQRPLGRPSAGFWEFPGGKLEAGETRTAGLARELREELGIEIREPRPLMRLRHVYSYGEVLIDMWVIRDYTGVPTELDGQALRWCTNEQLAVVDLLPADQPIVRALRLPDQLHNEATSDYVIESASALFSRQQSTRPIRAEHQLYGTACARPSDAVAAANAGVNFIVMSEPLAPSEIMSVCAEVSLPVFVRELPLKAAWALGATGVSHLII